MPDRPLSPPSCPPGEPEAAADCPDAGGPALPLYTTGVSVDADLFSEHSLEMVAALWLKLSARPRKGSGEVHYV